MKYLLLATLILLKVFPSFGQDIEQVIVSSQEADEPPTKQGRPEYIITFEKNTTEDFIALSYQVNAKRKKLSQPIVLDKERIKIYKAWKKDNKNQFELSQLDVNRQAIESKLQEANLKLSHNLVKEMIVSADSFQLCQSYKMTKTISTGGYKLEVIIVANSGEKHVYRFDSENIGEGNFNLKNYLYTYQLIGNKLPKEFPHFNFFTKERMEKILIYYLKTIECEGYHYKEFIKKNPNRTAQENRMMKDWDFAEYMEQNKSKK